MSEKEIQDHPDKKRYCFYSESEEVNQEWFSMLFRCTLPNHFCCTPVPSVLLLASFYYSGTPEEKRILIPLPRLKGSGSFCRQPRRLPRPSAPRTPLEEAADLRNPLRLLPPQRGRGPRDEAQHAHRAYRRFGEHGVRIGRASSSLARSSTTRNAFRTH